MGRRVGGLRGLLEWTSLWDFYPQLVGTVSGGGDGYHKTSRPQRAGLRGSWDGKDLGGCPSDLQLPASLTRLLGPAAPAPGPPGGLGPSTWAQAGRDRKSHLVLPGPGQLPKAVEQAGAKLPLPKDLLPHSLNGPWGEGSSERGRRLWAFVENWRCSGWH